MHNIFFYEDEQGNSPVFDFIEKLSEKDDKDSKINSNKIHDYLEVLSKHGKAVGEPYIKHLDGDIWELRPLKHRLLFAAWVNNSFIILHHFHKKTQKTPKREIDKAKRNLKNTIERGNLK